MVCDSYYNSRVGFWLGSQLKLSNEAPACGQVTGVFNNIASGF